MNENRSIQHKNHTVKMDNRKRMSLDGVRDVISFDDGEVVLVTENGEMTVEGRELHISVLDLTGGSVMLDGIIDAVYYIDENEEKSKRASFFRRAFR